MTDEKTQLAVQETSSLSHTTVRDGPTKITREDFIRHLTHNLDDYDKVAVSPEEVKTIHRHIQKLSTGSAAMTPMFCGGEKCPFKTRCPLFAIGKHPLNKQCLLENQLMKEWILRYFDEYNVDPNNFTEVAYVNELAEIEILLMRLNMNLAKPENSSLTMDQMVGMSPDGSMPIIQTIISPLMEMKEKLQNRRSRVIKLMVGDRQEKYKKEAALKIKLEKDPSSRQANMRSKLEALSRELDRYQKNMRDTHEAAGTPSPIGKVLTPEDIIDSEVIPKK